MPWPTPMHMVQSASVPPRRCSSSVAVSARRAPRHAERMAERDGAAVGIDVLGVVGEAELAQHRQALGGEGLVELDRRRCRRCSRPSRSSSFSRRRRRADAHDPRRHAGDGGAERRGRAASGRGASAAASEAMISAAAPSLTPEALPAVTVPSGRTIGFSFAERLERRVARGCSSRSTTSGSPFRCGIVDRRRSRRRSRPFAWRRRGALLAAQREGVLVGAADRRTPAATFSPVSASSRRRRRPSSSD